MNKELMEIKKRLKELAKIKSAEIEEDEEILFIRMVRLIEFKSPDELTFMLSK